MAAEGASRGHRRRDPGRVLGGAGHGEPPWPSARRRRAARSGRRPRRPDRVSPGARQPRGERRALHHHGERHRAEPAWRGWGLDRRARHGHRPVSRRNTCRASSSAFIAWTRAGRASRAAPGWAWRSCVTSSMRMAVGSRRPAFRGAAPPSACSSRPPGTRRRATSPERRRAVTVVDRGSLDSCAARPSFGHPKSGDGVR